MGSCGGRTYALGARQIFYYIPRMDGLRLGKSDLCSAGGKTAPRGSWAIWAKWTFILALAYILSLGPAARIYQDVPASRSVIQAVYSPLETIFQLEPAKRVLKRYAAFWGFKDD